VSAIAFKNADVANFLKSCADVAFFEKADVHLFKALMSAFKKC
jgi:hypothetical protein